jgi:hypothetical protein
VSIGKAAFIVRRNPDPVRTAELACIRQGTTLVGDPVVAGFRCPVAVIFA